jgi:nucleoprotein TPR
MIPQAQEFARTRESLVGAETSKKHLEERILDLTKQLQGNDEKLAVYERRTSVSTSVPSGLDRDLSHDQQAEVAELRLAKLHCYLLTRLTWFTQVVTEGR